MGAGSATAGTAPHARIVFSRHGESEWNVANKFTGWVDVDLSEKGIGEGKQAGTLIKEEGLKFDVVYTSVLKRAIKTSNLALEGADQMHVPQIKSWRLNERMYGGLTGLNKVETAEKYGAEQVKLWRRSYDVRPPDADEGSEYYPANDDEYLHIPIEDLPKAECLKDCIERTLPYWFSDITPALKRGKTILIAAHGNSIRGMLKHLDKISDEDILGVEVPTAIPLIYHLDENLEPLPTGRGEGALTGYFLRQATAENDPQLSFSEEFSGKHAQTA